MELRHFRYFVAVAEYQSFTRAADRLHVSQPTLSQQVRDLERALGVSLFERGPQGTRLTPAGAAFYDRIRVVLTDVDVAARAARAARDVSTLRVGITVPMPDELHLPVMSAFAAAHPHVRLVWRELTMVELDEPLISGEVDVALLRLPVDSIRVAWEPLVDEPRGLVVSRSHPLWDADVVDLAEALDEAYPTIAPIVPERMVQFWLMHDERAGEAPRFIGEPSATPYELLLSVRLHGVICPAPYAFRHTTLLSDTKVVRLSGVSDATAVAARRRDDDRPLPKAFCALAAETARQLTA